MKGHGRDPVVVVNHARGVVAVEGEEAGQLLFDRARVFSHLFEGEQVAFLGLAAGVAHHGRGAAHQAQHAVAVLLEVRQRENGQHVAHVQAVGRGVEPDIDNRLFLCQAVPQRRVRDLLDHVACLQFIKYRFHV